jgi:hypothetical protein
MIEMSPKTVARYAAEVVKGKKSLKDFVPEEAEAVRAHLQNALNANTAQLPRAEKKAEDKEGGDKVYCESSPEQRETLLSTLKERFHAHPELHEGVEWDRVEKTLRSKPKVLWSVQWLEETGGEPDVFVMESSEKYDGRPDPFNKNKEGFYIGDCSAESPSKRAHVPYDRKAEEYLANQNPDLKIRGNASDMAKDWDAELMSERQFRHLYGHGPLNHKTKNWLKTPDYVREGSSDSERNEVGYFANYAYCDVDGVIVHRAKIYDRDEAFIAPRCSIKVYWEEGNRSQRAS